MSTEQYTYINYNKKIYISMHAFTIGYFFFIKQRKINYKTYYTNRRTKCKQKEKHIDIKNT